MPLGVGSTISVDGEQLPQVRAFSVHADAHKASRVVVGFIDCEVTITGAVGEVDRNTRNPDHARLIAESETHDVVQYDDGSFEIVKRILSSHSTR